jgi:hypothetical protein
LGKTLGFIGAVVLGVAVTALTAGAAGPIAAGIIGGFVAGAGGELIEAAVDKRPTSVGRVLLSGALGAALGGAFSGAGQLLARTGLGAVIAENVGRSAIGQAASRALYKLATSPSAPAVAARTVASGIRQGITGLEKAGEALGRGMGGPFAKNALRQAAVREGLESATNQAAESAAARAAAAGREPGKADVAATIQGEVNGQRVNATTFAGQDKSGTGYAAIQTPEGRVSAPDPLPEPLRPVDAPKASGQVVPRGNDAEIKLFGYTLKTFGSKPTGRLYLGVTSPMCPSCSVNGLTLQNAAPGLELITRVPIPYEGGAGALAPPLLDGPSSVPPVPPNAVEFQLHF